MKIDRREFIRYAGVGVIASSVRNPIEHGGNAENPEQQKIHPDFQSNIEGTEYYFIGNGLILAAIQSVRTSTDGTHCGLLLMSPEHFGRKMSTYLYHPERGLLFSRSLVTIDKKVYAPNPQESKLYWEYQHDVPTIVIEWKAGSCTVREELFCPAYDAAIIRKMAVRNDSTTEVEASFMAWLYPNLMFFDEYHVDRSRMTLTARGYQTLCLFTDTDAMAGSRNLNIQLGRLAAGETKTSTVFLTLNFSREEFEKKNQQAMISETQQYWHARASFHSKNPLLDHIFSASKTGIRSAIARSGKMDGSIWQYNMEWVRDQSMVACAAAMSGFTDISAALNRRMLAKSVDDTGMTVESSRFVPPETIELDQNGELLYSLYTHWVWTGDDSILREYWPKIKNVAEYVLQPMFLNPETGLVKNSREYWERDPGFGVKEGYENSYQLWNIVGLEKASIMAGYMNDKGLANQWMAASAKMNRSFVSHPKYSLVEDGRFIKRRLVSGEQQTRFEPPNRAAMPPGMPLNVENINYCDPDTSSVLPIVYGVVDPTSPLAKQTLASMEVLWNQRWKTGGYSRYHVSSEPDSPGPWPFATMFVARAYLEAGDHEKVWRALDWLGQVQGGKAGAWFECYGQRPTPPLPPLGIVVWTWAEILMFLIDHMLGVRPEPQKLRIRPRLLDGLGKVDATVVLQSNRVALTIEKTSKEKFALIDGVKKKLDKGVLEIPIPRRDVDIKLHI